MINKYFSASIKVIFNLKDLYWNYFYRIKMFILGHDRDIDLIHQFDD